MTIDRDAALGATPRTREISWTERDVILYHLGVGAGTHPLDPQDLAWCYEKQLAVLPTFAVVAGQGVSSGARGAPSMALPGIDVPLASLLHAGQRLDVYAPIPASGTARIESRVAEVWDKAKAAVVVLEDHAHGEDGPLWTSRSQIWMRGEGGFGGPAGPGSTDEIPEREPDAVVETPTAPGQAALYRLSGDLNPLHIDPAFAAAVGFDRPILHGLATYGIVCRGVVEDIAEGKAARVRSWSVRFAGPVIPGETLRTAVWRDGDGLTLRTSIAGDPDRIVLDRCRMELS